MKRNRDYTGLERTPSSMAWLIRRRQLAKGQLDKLMLMQARLPAQITALTTELAALDSVIPLHEVRVNPAEIQGRRPQRKSLAPRGEMTRLIIQCLKLGNQMPVQTPEIAYYFARQAGIEPGQVKHSDLMTRISKRLEGLHKRGIVQRHHDLVTTDMGQWSLVLD